MLQVEQVRDIHTDWHVMSLAILNADRDELSDDYKDLMAKAMGPVRVCIAAEEQGPEILLPLYTALGNRIHVQQRGRDEEQREPIMTEALEEAGLPASLADAAHPRSTTRRWRLTPEGMDPVGMDVGTPVIHFNGTPSSGPW